MVYLPSEEKGFLRHRFPWRYYGHEVKLLSNDAYVTDEGRLRVHLTGYCTLCREEYTIRGRYHPSCEDHDYYAALSKFALLSKFSDICPR